jgi:tripartite-type tricarboxylate transporter receptor subunit TctC
VGYESITLANKYGVTIAISQFRAIVVRAGTDPKQVAVLSDALEKAAKSEDFRKFLAEELAFADSFIPAKDATRFVAEQLALIEASSPKKA